MNISDNLIKKALGVFLVIFSLAVFLFLRLETVRATVNQEEFEVRKNEIIHLGQDGKLQESWDLLERTKLDFPEERTFYSSTYFDLANHYYMKKDYEKANQILERSTAENKLNQELQGLYARVLAKTGKVQDAWRIIKQFPNDADTFEEEYLASSGNIWAAYNLAAAHALLGNPTLAMKYLETVILLYYEEWSVKKTMESIERESDFDSLREMDGYENLKLLVQSQPYIEVAVFLKKALGSANDIGSAVVSGSITNERGVIRLDELQAQLADIITADLSLAKLKYSIVAYITRMVEFLTNQTPNIESEIILKTDYNNLLNEAKYAEAQYYEVVGERQINANEAMRNITLEYIKDKYA